MERFLDEFQRVHAIWWGLITGMVIPWALSKILPVIVPEYEEHIRRAMRLFIWIVSSGVALIILGCVGWIGWKMYHQVPGPPTVETFVAEPQAIELGTSVQLRWEVNGATDIVIDQGVGRVKASGNAEVKPQTSTIYSLTAAGPNGKVLRHATVEVAPPRVPVIKTFVADPNSINSIEASSTARLRWEVTGATDVFIDHGVGRVGLHDSREVRPATSTNYVLTAAGPGGRLTAEAAITVADGSHTDSIDPPPTIQRADIQKFWSPLSLLLAHHHRVGGSPTGTFSVSPSGISWLLPDHPEESFSDISCSAMMGYDSGKRTFDLTVNVRQRNERGYQFKANSDSAFESVRIALYALCESPRLMVRGEAEFERTPLGGVNYDSQSVSLYSQDKGDSVLFRFEPPTPWLAMLIVDANQNGIVDAGDLVYGNQGPAPCHTHPSTTASPCNEFNSAEKLDVEQRERPLNRWGTIQSRHGGPLLSVTHLIPKGELSTKEPFVMVFLYLHNTNTREDKLSEVIKIPFAMGSDSKMSGLPLRHD